MIYAAEQTKSAIETIGVPITVAVIAALATLGAACVSFILGRLGDAAARRRAGYARASSALVALAEYPYRIRRRTADDGAVLGDLVAKGSDLQQELRSCETWVMCENNRMGEVWREVLCDIKAATAPACKEAWNSPPIATAAGMNLGSWGPHGVEEKLKRFEKAARWRFGKLRMVGWVMRKRMCGERGEHCKHAPAEAFEAGQDGP
jgi:hypothetical protein